MPSVRPKKPHAHPVSISKCHRLARPRAVVGKATGQSRVVELIADLLKDRDPPDANELRCFDLIRRFHRWGRRGTCHGLRLVTAPIVDNDGKPCLSADGRPLLRRFVWELACFEYATGPEWNWVTWAVDEPAATFVSFAVKQEAEIAFHSQAGPVALSCA